MKKLIVILLAIFCFYGCKSVHSDSDAYVFMNEDTTTDVYKRAYKGQIPLLAFFYENVCDHYNKDNLNIYGKRYKKIETLSKSYTTENTTYYAKKDFFGEYCKIIDSNSTALDSYITYQVLSDEGDHVKVEIQYFDSISSGSSPVNISDLQKRIKNGDIRPTRVRTITSNDKAINNICDNYHTLLEKNSENYITRELRTDENGYYHVMLYDSENNITITSSTPLHELTETLPHGVSCSWVYNVITPCKKDYMEYHNDRTTQKSYRCKVKTNIMTTQTVRDVVLTPDEE